MNTEHIISLARKAGWGFSNSRDSDFVKAQLCFAELVAAEEREACAKVCDEATIRFHALWEKFEYPEDQAMSIGASQCSAAIRERNSK